ncbi:cathecol 1,2-dioxygenase [Piedraia hortae CBS 480.64]|uniref:Cathecol 1,2-dioxygenase n=1 Tax=Piedraia hortae CBS 480.64 TaxID=1314780 RepID=A0A6A7C8J5_9PEZI|nr:cathecol 1,2-dioxygenase [Piedraia hortae CBS 480.64]
MTAPALKDLTIDNITENVKLVNSGCENPRLKYILERLVQHLHDFARETRLSYDEWTTGLLFLTAVGQKCTDVRQEFILLSDVLGLSLLVDSIDHPKPPKSTEGTVLGPFHSHEAEIASNGATIAHDPEGESCLVLCELKDTHGRPIPGAKIDIWETDSKGFYDVQYPGRDGPDQRAIMHSDANGVFWFKAIVPVSYPIPDDGPVGVLLRQLKRHNWRPAHIHFKFEASGFDPLITSLYISGDKYEASDAVFGVKQSLVIDLGTINAEQAKKYDVKEGSKLISHQFVLATDEEVKQLREKNARLAMEKLGQKIRFVDGLPVPDVD